METKEEPKYVEVPTPIFLNELDMQKMIYIMYNQDIPMIKDMLNEILKVAKEEKDGTI